MARAAAAALVSRRQTKESRKRHNQEALTCVSDRSWLVATSTFKAETYRFLRQDRPTPEEITVGVLFPAGTVHLPTWADGEWLKQLTAEQLITVKSKRGFSPTDDNEADAIAILLWAIETNGGLA